MRVSVLGSIFLHVFILLFTVLSLPLFNNNDLEMPPVIQVELIEIAEKTNVPQISKKIEEQKEHEKILSMTSSGGVCFNDVVLQAGIPELPFGGIGASGMGKYHGPGRAWWA